MLMLVRSGCLLILLASAASSIALGISDAVNSPARWLLWPIWIGIAVVLLVTVIAGLIDTRFQIGGWRAGKSRKADLIRWGCLAYAGVGVLVLQIRSTDRLNDVIWPASIVVIGGAYLFSHWYYEVPAVRANFRSDHDTPSTSDSEPPD